MPSLYNLWKQKQAALGPAGYLERAFMWLNSDLDLGVFYAALELRKCFESIWMKHGMASDDFSDDFTALHWRPDRLGEALNMEFILKIDFEKSYRFTHDPANPLLTMGYFLAMPNSLFEAKDRVNEFLHAQWAIPINSPDKKWLLESKAFLWDFATELIPHSNGENSLIRMTAPKIQVVEIPEMELKPLLTKRLAGIEKSSLG